MADQIHGTTVLFIKCHTKDNFGVSIIQAYALPNCCCSKMIEDIAVVGASHNGYY